MSRSIRATSRADCAVSTFWYARRASAAIRSRVAFISTRKRAISSSATEICALLRLRRKAAPERTYQSARCGARIYGSKILIVVELRREGVLRNQLNFRVPRGSTAVGFQLPCLERCLEAPKNLAVVHCVPRSFAFGLRQIQFREILLEWTDAIIWRKPECDGERGFVLLLLRLERSQALLRLCDSKVCRSSFDRQFTAFLHAGANRRRDIGKTLDLLPNQGNESC